MFMLPTRNINETLILFSTGDSNNYLVYKVHLIHLLVDELVRHGKRRGRADNVRGNF